MNKRVLVTGSSRGIGKAIAVRLAADGFHTVLHCRSGLEAASATAETITADGGSCSLLQFDIADREECQRLLEKELSEHGPFYGVICNAGIARDTTFATMNGDEWDSVIHTNLDGFFNVLQPCVAAMSSTRMKGRIVTISSISGLIGNKGQVNYSASKAGIIGATKALSHELARRGITVNCVAPGLIKTDMLADLPIEQIMQAIPMRRLGKPEEVAGVVSFLMSGDAAYMTGQVLSVNGGMA